MPSLRGTQPMIEPLRAVYAAPMLVLSGRFQRGLGGSTEVARQLGVMKLLPKPFTREEFAVRRARGARLEVLNS